MLEKFDLADYITYLQSKGIRDRSIVEYVRHVRRALAAGGDLAAPLRAAKSASAWQGAFAAVLHYAAFTGQGDLREVLCKAVPCPKRPPRETEPVQEQDWQKAILAAQQQPDPLRSVLEVLLMSGLRINDVLQITREAANKVIQYGSVKITQKGGRIREWAPSEDTTTPLQRLLALPEWQTLQDLIAPSHWKTAQNRLRKALAIVCQNAGVAYANPHRYRHTMATEMNEQGVDPRTMQKILGHASLQTTMKYVHPSAKRQREAVNSVLKRVLRKNK